MFHYFRKIFLSIWTVWPFGNPRPKGPIYNRFFIHYLSSFCYLFLCWTRYITPFSEVQLVFAPLKRSIQSPLVPNSRLVNCIFLPFGKLKTISFNIWSSYITHIFLNIYFNSLSTCAISNNQQGKKELVLTFWSDFLLVWKLETQTDTPVIQSLQTGARWPWVSFCLTRLKTNPSLHSPQQLKIFPTIYVLFLCR